LQERRDSFASSPAFIMRHFCATNGISDISTNKKFGHRGVKKTKNLRITVRIDEKYRKNVENLVESGKFKNISQVIRTALQEFLGKA